MWLKDFKLDSFRTSFLSGSEDYLGPPAASAINHPFYPPDPPPSRRPFSALSARKVGHASGSFRGWIGGQCSQSPFEGLKFRDWPGLIFCWTRLCSLHAAHPALARSRCSLAYRLRPQDSAPSLSPSPVTTGFGNSCVGSFFELWSSQCWKWLRCL